MDTQSLGTITHHIDGSVSYGDADHVSHPPTYEHHGASGLGYVHHGSVINDNHLHHSEVIHLPTSVVTSPPSVCDGVVQGYSRRASVPSSFHGHTVQTPSRLYSSTLSPTYSHSVSPVITRLHHSATACDVPASVEAAEDAAVNAVVDSLYGEFRAHDHGHTLHTGVRVLQPSTTRVGCSADVYHGGSVHSVPALHRRSRSLGGHSTYVAGSGASHHGLREYHVPAVVHRAASHAPTVVHEHAPVVHHTTHHAAPHCGAITHTPTHSIRRRSVSTSPPPTLVAHAPRGTHTRTLVKEHVVHHPRPHAMAERVVHAPVSLPATHIVHAPVHEVVHTARDVHCSTSDVHCGVSDAQCAEVTCHPATYRSSSVPRSVGSYTMHGGHTVHGGHRVVHRSVSPARLVSTAVAPTACAAGGRIVHATARSAACAPAIACSTGSVYAPSTVCTTDDCGIAVCTTGATGDCYDWGGWRRAGGTSQLRYVEADCSGGTSQVRYVDADCSPASYVHHSAYSPSHTHVAHPRVYHAASPRVVHRNSVTPVRTPLETRHVGGSVVYDSAPRQGSVSRSTTSLGGADTSYARTPTSTASDGRVVFRGSLSTMPPVEV